MQGLVHRYLNHGISRRGFMRKLSGLGVTVAAAESMVEALEQSEKAGAGVQVPGATSVTGSGGELVMAQAKAAGAEYLFCNPGSFEAGIYDAQISSGVPLIMGLHEGIVIAMADGYHRVSLRPAFVNVHVMAGTAQMSGQLYNASCDGSAMVITAGLLDNELWSDDAGLAPRPGFDQKEVPRQFTKLSWEAREPHSLALMVRRAFKTAVTPPGGPVYVAMADYALEAKNVAAQILPAERFLFDPRVRPDTAAIDQTARWLIEAKRPLIVVGDEVWKSGAQAALVAFAEEFRVPVGSGRQGYRNFPVKHPLHLASFSPSSPYMKAGCDLIVFVGARDFGGRTVPEGPEAPMDARMVRIGLDTVAMGRNYPTDLAIVADVRDALGELRASLESLITKQRLAAFGSARDGEVRGLSARREAAWDAAARKTFGATPMHPEELGSLMARTLDPNAIVVSENLTGTYGAFNFGFRDSEQVWIGNTGSSLGWGLGAAIGAKLAAPDRLVVCSIGDGSVMYASSAFWTQARYGVPVLTVVWNNSNYQTVRNSYYRYQGRMAASGHYAGMYLGDPDIDFVKLAGSQGVQGEKVATAAELAGALKRGIASTRDGKPYLLDVVVARYGGGAESTWHEGFKLSQRMKKA